MIHNNITDRYNLILQLTTTVHAMI